jgi:pyocin large subunit-like protein
MSNINFSNDSDSQEKYISFKNRGDLWKDITPLDEFSNEVNILKIDYTEELKEINDYFRAILKKNEISQRAFDLTTELLEVFLNIKLILNFNFFKFTSMLRLIIWVGIIDAYALTI